MRFERGGFQARLMAGAAVVGLLAGATAAQAAEKKFNIPPQTLETALADFSAQSTVSVITTPAVTQTKTTAGVVGEVEPAAALAQLLAGTGLSYRRDGDVFMIVQAGEGGGPQGESAAGGGAEVEALIVTAQKKEEQIQDVPIAISAFTQKSLDAQKIEGGFDLLKAIPNVSFSKSNFSGYNFSIRGIGTKAVSATTDPGVAVAFNNSTLIVNRLFEQEYFDVERVEVLRGPQGTLYGRNATGGVINVLSARPRIGEFEGDVKLEAGNYNARRARGMINIPVGDTLAIRAAGALTKRDGYGTNLAASDPLVTNDVREDVDGRDLWSARVTVGWEPIEQIRVNAMWERFEEDDNRVRTSKQLCHNDQGPQTIGAFNWNDVTAQGLGSPTDPINLMSRANTSQGCKAGSLYDDAAFGTPNGLSLPYVSGLFWGSFWGGFGYTGDPRYQSGLGMSPYFDHGVPGTGLPAPCPEMAAEGRLYPLNWCHADPYGGQMQSRDLRTIHSAVEPHYRAKADLFELSIDLDITDSLTFTSQTLYSRDEYYATQDYNRYTTFPFFADSSIACSLEELFPGFDVVDCSVPYAGGYYENLTLGGVFDDPQLGPSSSLLAQDLSKSESKQINQEFRLASNFDAPVNFSLGANFTHFETLNDYYVFINAATLLTYFFPFNVAPPANCYFTNQNPCVYVDPNPLESINGEGHNYFRSANPYELTSSAVFGELYWQATDTLKVTLGARMSWDQKRFTPVPSQLLLNDYRAIVTVPEGGGPETCPNFWCQLAGTGVDGRGSPPDPDIIQEWREPTGRLIVDWKPDLGFTDETMVYASIAHGYKGGGANPPPIAGPAGILNVKASGGVDAPRTFDPEFVDAFEVGTKNTLLGGALVLNGSAFYYDYKGYQVSKIVNRSAANENFDATVWGAELEWIFSPTRNLRFNGAFGALQTEIAGGERSIDLMDRTNGGGADFFLDADGVRHDLPYDEWMILKPWVSSSSNCVVPVELVELMMVYPNGNPIGVGDGGGLNLQLLCPSGTAAGHVAHDDPATGYIASFLLPGDLQFDPRTEAPNGGQGFFKELGGNELPNAPHWTASLGAQYRMALPGGWDATLRGDFYWQSQSYARVYNSQYDKLRAWTNTNLSLWVENPDWGVTAEVYVKNVFDETPITDAFLNSDDSGLTTNIFTLDPRLVGVSLRKSF